MEQQVPPHFDPNKNSQSNINNSANPTNGQYASGAGAKKKGKLDIDADYNFIFLKNWPPIVRWLLVIPMGFLGVLLVQLAYGFVIESLLKSFNGSDISRLVLNAIFTVLKFIVMITTMVATIPVKSKTKAAIGLAIIPILFMSGIVWLTRQPQVLEKYEFMKYEPYILFAAAMLGTIMGILNVKKSMNEEKINN